MGPASTPTACEAVAADLGMVGAGISLCGQPLAASDPVAAHLDDRQFVLGHGPLVDAYARVAPVELADVATMGALDWPHLGAELDAAGVGAVFAFPMVVGHAALGALTLYRERPRPLTARQRSGAWEAAATTALDIARLVLEAHEHEADVPALAPIDRLHRAVGTVMGQLRVGPEEATARLRAYVFSGERTLEDVVNALLSGALVLADDRTEATGGR
jgi:hypothetical protein